MDCRNAVEMIPAFLAGEPAPGLEGHLNACPSCSREKRALEALWLSMASTQAPTPAALRGRTLHHIQSLLKDEAAPALGLGKLAAAVVLGLLAALGAIYSLSHQVDLRAFSTGGIATCVTWWAGLFILAGCLIVGKHRLGRIQMAFVASTAAASVGLIMVGTYFCPKFELMRLWQSSVLGYFLGAAGGPGLSHLAFGFVYAVLPTFLVTVYFGRHLYGPWLRQGLWAAAAFLALLLPNLYVQCCFLPVTLGALLAFGVALGSLTGTLGALGLRRFSPREA